MADKITHIDGSYHYAEELPKHPTPPAPVTASKRDWPRRTRQPTCL